MATDPDHNSPHIVAVARQVVAIDSAAAIAVHSKRVPIATVDTGSTRAITRRSSEPITLVRGTYFERGD